jgi:uncharacterized protein (DUF305 family)
MDIQEIKKEIKNKVGKNTIIVTLSIALFVISAVAIGLAVDHEEYRNDREYNSEKFMGENSNEHMMQDGTMMNNNSGSSMGSTMTNMTSGMQGKAGKELEKAFLSEMVLHHQGAIDMAKLLLQDKTISPELTKFANGIISAQQPEINLMNEWLKKY